MDGSVDRIISVLRKTRRRELAMKNALWRLAWALIVVLAVIISKPWESVDFAFGTIAVLAVGIVIMAVAER